MAGHDIRFDDLGGPMLGRASGTTIWLDANAAGWGWFVDPTPRDDSEFTTPGNQGEQHHMGLLTVLEHEVGHLLGKEHADGGVMRETLTAGKRRTPTGDANMSSFAADALFALLTADDETPWIGSRIFGRGRMTR